MLARVVTFGIDGVQARRVWVEADVRNGLPAFASYKSDGHGGYYPWSIQVIETSGDRIVGHHNFLDTNLFAAFGLPPRLDA